MALCQMDITHVINAAGRRHFQRLLKRKRGINDDNDDEYYFSDVDLG